MHECTVYPQQQQQNYSLMLIKLQTRNCLSIHVSRQTETDRQTDIGLHRDKERATRRRQASQPGAPYFYSRSVVQVENVGYCACSINSNVYTAPFLPITLTFIAISYFLLVYFFQIRNLSHRPIATHIVLLVGPTSSNKAQGSTVVSNRIRMKFVSEGSANSLKQAYASIDTVGFSI